MGTLIINI